MENDVWRNVIYMIAPNRCDHMAAENRKQKALSQSNRSITILSI